MENEKTVLQRAAFPTLGDLLAMLGLFLVIEVACSILGAVVLLFSGQGLATLSPTAQGNYLAVVTFSSLAITSALIVWYRRWRGATPIRFGLQWRPFRPMLLVWGFVVMASAGILLEPIFTLLPPLDQNVGRGLGAVLALVVFVPLFEEFICRGVVYGSMRTRYSEVASVLLSALFFGVLHLHPTAVINAFVMGIVLAIVYRAAGTLWAPIALHALNNLSAYLMLVTGYGETTLWKLLAPHRWLYFLLYGLAAVVMIVAVVYLRKVAKNHDYIGKNTILA